MKERILIAKRKNTSNSASKAGMFFHFAVKFELFKEFCSIHKNYVVFFKALRTVLPITRFFPYRRLFYSILIAIETSCFRALLFDVCSKNKPFYFLLARSIFN